MRSLVASLLFPALLAITACGSSADQPQDGTTPADEVVTTALSPAPERAEEPEETVSNTADQTTDLEKEPVETATSQDKPQAIRTSQKKMINQAPKLPIETAEKEAEADPSPAEATSGASEAQPVESKPETTTEVPAPEVVKADKAPEQEIKTPAVPDHSRWNTLLQKHVTAAGKVNYSGFKKDQAQLKAYLDELAANPVQDSWSRSDKMAYWINVYNAFTIKLIVDNYPVSSITKLHGGKPWDVKWIKLGNSTYSLNEVENDILRPKYKDARIHFAVNCAAKSCPPLLNRAWTGENLNSYLEKQTKAFINNSAYNTISAKKAEVSKIFEWYAADFGDLVEFLNKYSETRINNGAKVTYKEYDWALNN